MKKLNFLKLSGTLFIATQMAFSLSLAKEVNQQPISAEGVISSSYGRNEVQAQIIGRLDRGEQIDSTEFFRLTGIPMATPISEEGVPPIVLNYWPPQGWLESYASDLTGLVNVIHQDARSMAAGDRLEYYLSLSQEIVKLSGKRPLEVYMRVTLNRAYDMVMHILPSFGNNSEYAGLALAKFLQDSFNLAISYPNNHFLAKARLTDFNIRPTYKNDEGNEVSQAMTEFSMASYGWRYAKFAFDHSQGLSSDSSKAIMLARILDYLMWDLVVDHRTREFQTTLADIARVKMHPAYNRSLNAIAKNQEPRQQDVAQMRYQAYQVIERLGQRLTERGNR